VLKALATFGLNPVLQNYRIIYISFYGSFKDKAAKEGALFKPLDEFSLAIFRSQTYLDLQGQIICSNILNYY
jgi:hypothetical protein